MVNFWCNLCFFRPAIATVCSVTGTGIEYAYACVCVCMSIFDWHTQLFTLFLSFGHSYYCLLLDPPFFGEARLRIYTRQCPSSVNFIQFRLIDSIDYSNVLFVCLFFSLASAVMYGMNLFCLRLLPFNATANVRMLESQNISSRGRLIYLMHFSVYAIEF